MTVAPELSWTSASLTDAGVVHSTNQDAYLDAPELGLWVVADGMGGHNEGHIASQLIVESLAQTDSHDGLSDLVNEVEDRLRLVHHELVIRAKDKGDGAIIGSTVAALMAVGQHGVCLWAGDSRIYRYRKGLLEQVTRDHSYVEDLVAEGSLQREEAESHPDANIITRAVGATDELYLDANLLQLCADDRYLICSDGLFKELSEATIRKQMEDDDSINVCRTLMAMALASGAHDNVAIVIVKFVAQRE